MEGLSWITRRTSWTRVVAQRLPCEVCIPLPDGETILYLRQEPSACCVCCPGALLLIHDHRIVTDTSPGLNLVRVLCPLLRQHRRLIAPPHSYLCLPRRHPQVLDVLQPRPQLVADAMRHDRHTALNPRLQAEPPRLELDGEAEDAARERQDDGEREKGPSHLHVEDPQRPRADHGLLREAEVAHPDGHALGYSVDRLAPRHSLYRAGCLPCS